MSQEKLDAINKELTRLKATLEADKAKERFFLIFTPEWFRWLSWIIVLGGLGWLINKSGSWILAVIYGLSFAFLTSYFEAFFFQRFRRLQDQRLTTAESQSHKWSFALAAVATLVSFLLSFYLVLLVSRFK